MNKSLYSNCFIRIKSKRCVISKRKFSILTRSKNLKNIFEVPPFSNWPIPEVSNIPKWHVFEVINSCKKKVIDLEMTYFSNWSIRSGSFLEVTLFRSRLYLKCFILKWPIFRSGPYFKSDLFSKSPFLLFDFATFLTRNYCFRKYLFFKVTYFRSDQFWTWLYEVTFFEMVTSKKEKSSKYFSSHFLR